MPSRRGKLSIGSRRRGRGTALVVGSALAAAAAGVLFKRDRVQALLPGGSSEPAAPPEPLGAPPATGPSNADVAGPPANTATHVPVPQAYEPTVIDEAEEEAAAAAEAANIGGQVSDYAGLDGDLDATPEERPLAEAGEGYAEGQELAEAELVEAAEPYDGMSPYEAQIEDAIREAGDPLGEETVEPLVSGHGPSPGDAEQRAAEAAARADLAADQAERLRAPAEPPAASGGAGGPGGTAGVQGVLGEPDRPGIGGTAPGGEVAVPFGRDPAEPGTQAAPPAPGATTPATPPASAPTPTPAPPESPVTPPVGEEVEPSTPGTSEPQGEDSQRPSPKGEDAKDADEWRTWSGRSVNP